MPSRHAGSAREVFIAFLTLGLTSFGGPVAHLGYFRTEFVQRRRWLPEQDYADLVALCQFLPGPASSQVGMALGMLRASYAGALAAWTGFTLPSAILLVLFAAGLSAMGDRNAGGALHGLEVVSVAVVAQAVWGMGRNLCVGSARIAIMVAAATAVLLHPSIATQIGIIVLASLAGLFLPTAPAAAPEGPPAAAVASRRSGTLWLALFAVLLLLLPVSARVWPHPALSMFDAFYRAGSLVFGGGHVVLPLLQAEVVPRGWVGEATFLAGYGAAQAVPGPLFTFAAFLGASMQVEPSGWRGAALCLGAIFLPSFLLVAGALPFWQALRRNRRVQAGLAGINAAVVGLLLAALYRPVWLGAVRSPADFAMVLIAAAALMAWKLPPWLVVLTSGVAYWGLTAAG